jgi:hypothetical protein
MEMNFFYFTMTVAGLSRFHNNYSLPISKPVRGGSSELGRVSEHLEEIPPLLARPSPPKSCDGFRLLGVQTWG